MAGGKTRRFEFKSLVSVSSCLASCRSERVTFESSWSVRFDVVMNHGFRQINPRLMISEMTYVTSLPSSFSNSRAL
jgi:hypothetical protein